MASLESKLFYHFLRLIKKKKFLDLQFAFGKFDFNNSREPPRGIRDVCRVKKYQVCGRNVFTLSPLNSHDGPPARHILYLHGGAYVQGFVRLHWKFLSRLVQETNCTITAPDYPLAPAHTYQESFAMVTPICLDIMTHAGERNVILMGDSAGGGFALALAQYLRQIGMGQPARLVLLCPWLDITLSNPEISQIDALDPFLGVGALRRAGLAYAGSSSPDNFMLSPINGSLRDLAEIFVFMGSHDILVADARKLKLLAEEQGAAVNYSEYAGMVHMWMFMNFPEARKAHKEIMQCLT